MSTGSFSGRSDALTYRAAFALRWQRIIHSNFASPTQVAAAFRVDPSTAENWWAGTNAPSGWVVGKALCDPALADSVMTELTRTEHA